MPTVKTTLNIDSEVMKTIKLIAVNNNKTQTEVVNKYLKQGILNEKEISHKETLKERIKRLELEDKVKIANEKTYNPGSNNFKKLIGSVKAPKNFDPVKAIDEIHDNKV
jgi:tRNA 2-selenouridine synthase SelU